MTLIVNPKFTALDDNGDPLEGGKVYFYEPGTTTPKDTYSDSDLNTTNSNPVILDANGQADIFGDGEYRVILDDANDVQRWDKDNVIGVQNLVVQESEWISGSANPTYVSGTQFTVPNDQTTTFQVGRRIKTTQTSGTEYGTIVNSAFTTLTTVDVEMDSTNLDSGLSNVDVSVLSVTNPSLPDLVTVLTAGVYGVHKLINGDAFSYRLLHIQDQKSAGTDGGDFNSGAWRTRDLNTVLTNEITGASLSSNAITLPAGKYYIEASAPAYEVERHMVRLYNTTDSSLVISGTSEFTNTSNQISNRSFVSGRFLITAEKAFEIQHQCQTTRATSGFGVDSNTAFTVDHETYTDVKIWQIA